jgi:hypothetical protein
METAYGVYRRRRRWCMRPRAGTAACQPQAADTDYRTYQQTEPVALRSLLQHATPPDQRTANRSARMAPLQCLLGISVLIISRAVSLITLPRSGSP